MNFVTYWLYSASSLSKTGYFFSISWAHVSPRVNNLRTHACTSLNSWISFSRENLIVTKVSLRKINSYQDLNRLQLEEKQNFAGYTVKIVQNFDFMNKCLARYVLFAVRSCPMKPWFQVSWEDTSLPTILTFKLKRSFIFKDCCKLIQGKVNISESNDCVRMS